MHRILQFSDYFRFPHVQYFASIPDLLERRVSGGWLSKHLSGAPCSWFGLVGFELQPSTPLWSKPPIQTTGQSKPFW